MVFNVRTFSAVQATRLRFLAMLSPILIKDDGL
jgi:hypothetical protein